MEGKVDFNYRDEKEHTQTGGEIHHCHYRVGLNTNHRRRDLKREREKKRVRETRTAEQVGTATHKPAPICHSTSHTACCRRVCT